MLSLTMFTLCPICHHLVTQTFWGEGEGWWEIEAFLFCTVTPATFLESQ